MSTSSVAVEGDVLATAGTVPHSADKNVTGSWSAGPVVESTYSELKVDGLAVVYEAQCTFTYAGGTAPAGTLVVPVGPFTETVSLTATTKILQNGTSYVLVDGDVEESSFQNKLEVKATGHLKTA
jgi:hypothetical protein